MSKRYKRRKQAAKARELRDQKWAEASARVDESFAQLIETVKRKEGAS